ncbi:hypothetical protein ACCS67_35015, partial [Rhizobium brockwellii]
TWPFSPFFSCSGTPDTSVARQTRRWLADPALLASAREAAIRDPALRKRLGVAADSPVRQYFDYQSSFRQRRGLVAADWP